MKRRNALSLVKIEQKENCKRKIQKLYVPPENIETWESKEKGDIEETKKQENPVSADIGRGEEDLRL